MEPKQTGIAYDSITHLWERKEFNRNNGISQYKRALGFAKNRGAALDVGCGCTGRHIELLQTEGFATEGIDVSEKMIEIARDKHPNVHFYLEDICEWKATKKYDFISAWDSIWHIPIEKQEETIRNLVSYLNKEGVLIFSFGGTDKEGYHTNDAMGPRLYYSTLGTNKFIQLLISSDCICRHLEYDQSPELHAYIIAQRI
ncbi:class I SAM-dependent methyltransferase [Microbulbifer sp. TRSA001]|uniref:class I SAM-dependent methyltransferase n=1 Tax=unclassified Microbulbifer TaxID=2619833 RepID=UPI0024ACFDC4|nr:class I SAM-dependent methyltransferase [Microbulbifer sp. VAAF005]WHI48373.1 class I SAM-dependent methyltransferase [Microbulbifer sp. VAAF005]